MPTPQTRTRTQAPKRSSRPARSRRRKSAPAPAAAPAAKRERYAAKSRASTVKAKKRVAESLPSWQDLDTRAAQQPVNQGLGARFLEQVSTVRLLVVILAIAVVFTAYVGHIHATQALLTDVQDVRRENMQLHLKYNRLKGDFDRATGPEVISRRAEALGLQPGAAFGPVIVLEE